MTTYFRLLWDSLTKVKVNPVNRKCTTLPILTLGNRYSINFHLSWLAFWSAFLSWFAFSPLIPEAVKNDLKLSTEQIGNSNIISLLATLVVRVIVGPLIDAYGPRKTMAGLLILGAIPSGLPGVINSAGGLYAVRFFIGILGGTFVSCQAWTTAFFDTNIVGRANAISAGWGNSGGGFTFVIMVALNDRLLADGMSRHVAWRAAFAIVPVPVLLTVAILCLVFGSDHPNGRWEDRHLALADDAKRTPDFPTLAQTSLDNKEKNETTVGVRDVDSEVTKAVNQKLTLALALGALSQPLTWLPTLAYMITFGYELAIDANLANVIFNLYQDDNFGQTKAGYLASTFGLLNIFTRPLGGWAGDKVYDQYGVSGKKYLMIACGFLQGAMSLAWGLYIDSTPNPSLGIFILLMVLCAIFCEAGNGANFALVPHCNPNSNGSMCGLVGAFGNVGGVIFALIFRFQTKPAGKAFWISGVFAMGVNLLLTGIRVPVR
ncbi:nitrate transporter [Dendrothele bispora CBS 962.96]|uniref:Nitrate/nitrite transporter n=1 Tax=Dendrothele bispora (strain CBS 962.96) TaxID=1314807 RepID=A0A4S8M2K1_DENBC|nr:nitrate transporter [Dendrothele bispora CBS 962.96]